MMVSKMQAGRWGASRHPTCVLSGRDSLAEPVAHHVHCIALDKVAQLGLQLFSSVSI